MKTIRITKALTIQPLLKLKEHKQNAPDTIHYCVFIRAPGMADFTPCQLKQKIVADYQTEHRSNSRKGKDRKSSSSGWHFSHHED